MIEGIVSIIIGIVCFVIGISNRKGNISMLHRYHINNVKEEDKLPLGKLVGIGMFIVGITLFIYGVLLVVIYYVNNSIIVKVSNIILIVGLVLGLGITLFAIKKYNKKIIG